MKSLFLVAALALSTGVFASEIENKIKQIESHHNARCDYLKTSWAFCPGATYTAKICFYNVKYICFSQDGDFEVKVKAKSFYDQTKNARVEKIRKVKIKK